MKSEKLFLLKVSLLNSIGYFLVTMTDTYLDANFRSQVHPIGYYIGFIAPVLFLLTIISINLSFSWMLKAAWPSLCLIAVGCISLLNFRPILSQGAVLGGLASCCLVSFTSSWIYYVPFKFDWIDDSSINSSLKLERIKEIVTIWRTLAISLAFGFLAILFPWIKFVMDLNLSFKNDELLQRTVIGVAGVILTSIYIVFGVLYEAFRKASMAADLLLLLDMDNVKDK
jgi:hypothetical protein